MNRVVNYDFETDTSGWVAGGNFSIARDVSKAARGAASLLATATFSGSASTWRAAAYLGLTIPNGQAVTVAARIWIPSAGWNPANVIKLQWLDGAAAAGDANAVAADMTKLDQWQDLFVQAVGNGSVNQGVRIYATPNCTATEKFWIDQVTLAYYGEVSQHDDAESVYAALVALGYSPSEAQKASSRIK